MASSLDRVPDEEPDEEAEEPAFYPELTKLAQRITECAIVAFLFRFLGWIATYGRVGPVTGALQVPAHLLVGPSLEIPEMFAMVVVLLCTILIAFAIRMRQMWSLSALRVVTWFHLVSTAWYVPGVIVFLAWLGAHDKTELQSAVGNGVAIIVFQLPLLWFGFACLKQFRQERANAVEPAQ